MTTAAEPTWDEERQAYVLVLPYTPHGAARALWDCRDREILLEGPAGTGKTVAVLQYCNWLCEHYPGVRILWCRDTLQSLRESVLVTWEERVLWPDHPAIGNQTRAYRTGYTYPNGAQIVLHGLSEPARTYSAEYDVVVLFEGANEVMDPEPWIKLLRVNRHWGMPWQQMIADTNPGAATHWLNVRADEWCCRVCGDGLEGPESVCGRMDQDEGRVCGGSARRRMRRLLSRHRDNPELWDHRAGRWTERGREYLAGLRGMHGATRRRLLDGVWCSHQGQVWSNWDRAVHLVTGRLWRADDTGEYLLAVTDWGSGVPVSGAPIELKWFVGGQDAGYVNPGCAQVWGFDADGRGYMVSELYRTGQTRAWWAEQWADIYRTTPVVRVIHDHDPELAEQINRALRHASGRDDLPALATPADKVRRGTEMAGIDEVRTRLDPRPDGTRGLYVLRDNHRGPRERGLVQARRPIGLAEEVEGYVYPSGSDGKPVPRDRAEDPDPQCPNHACDTTRYVFRWVKDRDLSGPPAPEPAWHPLSHAATFGTPESLFQARQARARGRGRRR